MKLDKLFNNLEGRRLAHSIEVRLLKEQIQAILDSQFDDWQALQTVLKDTHKPDGYTWNECGGIDAWSRLYGLAEVPEREREYLENYLSDRGYSVDFQNECVLNFLGDDEITVNVDGRSGDRGVYQGQKQIIHESDYTDENGDVDEAKRNQLIEQHMEKTGYFPGVYETDRHGNITPITTQMKPEGF